MGPEQSRKADSVSLDSARLIDRLCDEYELAWLSGARPDLNKFLERAPVNLRKQLLRELLACELGYRVKVGETPQIKDYLPGLGDAEPLLHEVFESYFSSIASLAPADDVVRDTVDFRVEASSSLADPDTTKSARPRNKTKINVADSVPLQFGDYEILEEIARGGMGIVYKARQKTLNRIVAVKMILSGELATTDAVKRFHSEARAAARLQHPGIIAVHEVGEIEGRHFFSMAYVEGDSLGEICSASPLAGRRAADYVRQIAAAVQYAHEQGVLHRDIKPSNVLIDRSDHPRVMDFGLAKQIDDDSELTRTGQVLGTPSYMAPEQALGRQEQIDVRTDVYALGALLYALATGRPPFRAESSAATLVQVIENEPVAPRLLNSDIDRDLETITLKCLEKEPERRYATARDLTDDLSRFLRGEPILARPLGRAARIWRWCKRKPALATLAACLMVAVITGLTSTTLAMRKAQSESRIARRAEQDARRESQAARTAERDATEKQRRAEAAELLAGRRADRIRNFSMNMLFDAHDRAISARGGLQLRRYLVDTGLGLIHELVQESGRDPGTLSDLTSGYIRLARLQFDPDGLSLRDSAGALDSYRKAIEILDDLDDAEETPTGIRRARCLLGIGDVRSSEGKVEEALSQYRTALALAQAHPTLSDEDDQGLELIAQSHHQIGQTHYRTKQFEAALEEFESAAAVNRERQLFDDDGQTLRQLAIDYQMIAYVHVRTGRYRQSIPWFKKCIDRRTEYINAHPDEVAVRAELAMAHIRITAALQQVGGDEEMARHVRLAYELRLPLTNVAAGDYEPVRLLAADFAALSGFYLESGRPRTTAIDLERRSTELYDALLKFNPDDVSLRSEAVMRFMHLGSLFLDNEDHRSTIKAMTRAIEISDEFPGTDVTGERYQVLLYHMAGGLHAVIGSNPAEPTKYRIGRWQDARFYLQKALSVFKALRIRGVSTGQGEVTLSDLSTKIEACDQALAALQQGKEPPRMTIRTLVPEIDRFPDPEATDTQATEKTTTEKEATDIEATDKEATDRKLK